MYLTTQSSAGKTWTATKKSAGTRLSTDKRQRVSRIRRIAILSSCFAKSTPSNKLSLFAPVSNAGSWRGKMTSRSTYRIDCRGRTRLQLQSRFVIMSYSKQPQQVRILQIGKFSLKSLPSCSWRLWTKYQRPARKVKRSASRHRLLKIP